MRSTFSTAALLASLALLSATAAPPAVAAAPGADVAAAPAPAAQAGAGKDADNERVIQPKDKLTIVLEGLEGPDQATVAKPVVDDQGQVKLPYLKQRVTAKGLTPKQLQAAIDKAYRDSALLESANSSVSVVPGKPGEKERVIRPKDRLTIAVRDLEAPNKDTMIKAVVDEKGQITLPYVKAPVGASDLTCDQLEDVVIKAYRDAALIQEGVVKVVFAKEQKP